MARSARVEDVRELRYRDMKKAEALTEIGRIIGFRGHKRSRLGKRDLNSIYWYITGDQICPRIDFGTKRSPEVFHMRLKVAHECGFPYQRFMTDKGPEDCRPFRRNELRAIVRKIRQSEDKRQSTATTSQ